MSSLPEVLAPMDQLEAARQQAAEWGVAQQYAIVFAMATLDPDVTRKDLAIISAIFVHMDWQSSRAWPSYATVARMADCDETYVEKRLRFLIGRGFLLREAKRRAPAPGYRAVVMYGFPPVDLAAYYEWRDRLRKEAQITKALRQIDPARQLTTHSSAGSGSAPECVPSALTPHSSAGSGRGGRGVPQSALQCGVSPPTTHSSAGSGGLSPHFGAPSKSIPRGKVENLTTVEQDDSKGAPASPKRQASDDLFRPPVRIPLVLEEAGKAAPQAHLNLLDRIAAAIDRGEAPDDIEAAMARSNARTTRENESRDVPARVLLANAASYVDNAGIEAKRRYERKARGSADIPLSSDGKAGSGFKPANGYLE